MNKKVLILGSALTGRTCLAIESILAEKLISEYFSVRHIESDIKLPEIEKRSIEILDRSFFKMEKQLFTNKSKYHK